MFEDLDWRGALKRAALTVLFYLVLVYVLNVAIPGSVGSPAVVAMNAAFLFVLFVVFHAFVDRRKRRRQAQMRTDAKGKKPAGKGTPKAGAEEDDEDAEPSVLKGRQNPNTSRKKAARRRR